MINPSKPPKPPLLLRRKIEIAITQEDLDGYREHLARIQQWPLDGRADGLFRAEIVLISKIVELGILGDDTTGKVCIKMDRIE